MKKTWVEVQCDQCGSAEHFVPGTVNMLMREYGWIIVKRKLHFCSRECLEKYVVSVVSDKTNKEELFKL